MEKLYDSNGNLIYKMDHVRKEYWFKYDYNGNVIYQKTSYKNCTMACFKDEPTKEEWWQYDRHKNIIYYKNSETEFEEWREYNIDDELIYRRDSSFEYFYHKGKEIFAKNLKKGTFYNYEYKDSITIVKGSDGSEKWYDRNHWNITVYYKNSKGVEKWYDPNKRGKIIRTKYKGVEKNIE